MMADSMPHVEVKCYPGRTEEQKRKYAEKITKVIMETMGCDETSVSVAIKEIEKDDWKEKVWDKQIISEEEYLYKKPGYSF